MKNMNNQSNSGRKDFDVFVHFWHLSLLAVVIWHSYSSIHSILLFLKKCPPSLIYAFFLNCDYQLPAHSPSYIIIPLLPTMSYLNTIALSITRKHVSLFVNRKSQEAVVDHHRRSIPVSSFAHDFPWKGAVIKEPIWSQHIYNHGCKS